MTAVGPVVGLNATAYRTKSGLAVAELLGKPRAPQLFAVNVEEDGVTVPPAVKVTLLVAVPDAGVVLGRNVPEQGVLPVAGEPTVVHWVPPPLVAVRF
ncbi:hypothetical protein ITJ66_16785 [Plantibacter sp. VKM Ac-2885]|uniref:hypothetical protein n=1 Tax=Plantibacter sp. VKM Ac-2885 TaxID=2783828 RepID=UPI00188B3091|nr:hypothetical protein [Plantibacter sp. VKM Ac-2885]MBF4514144.1 hypothetical protein [Plantibacter sp. VKM Ac-2885]